MSVLDLLRGFTIPLRQVFRPRITEFYPKEKSPKPERLHGRHVLNRYEDGMEKCIGCELCAGVCPARCIYVRGADNPPDAPVAPGERYGFVYEINYLRCIHCDMCVEACPTEAITETKQFEFSFTNRDDAIYTKDDLLVDDEGQARRLPWELWLGNEDDDTSGWMRATSPSGDAGYEGKVSWSAELGYGIRPPEKGQSSVTVEAVLFFFAAALALGGAVGVVLGRNPVHCALLLVVTLVAVAIFFLLQDAQLVAAVQIIVYAGAIVVLFLFVIMLLGVDKEESLRDPIPYQRPAAVALGAILLAEIFVLAGRTWATGATSVRGSVRQRVDGQDLGNVQRVARTLFTDFLWAFELTAVLLVIAVVGAVVLARRSGQRAELDEHERAIEEQITEAELSEGAEEGEEEVVTP